ncbi:MAG: DUF4168 domain-containing protein [Brevundimonas sp.]|uniref:DUF4168 domain-containing protein n=1 Tax=Brevundimonas sp. TaxID=1871086 RepID=UPI0040344632
MRRSLLIATSVLAVSAVPALATAQDAPPPAAPAPATPAPTASAVTDAQLEAFAAAMVKVREISAGVQGGTPTTEQQAGMAAAIEASGLGITQFNAISTQVSADPVMRARLAVATAPEPAAGSVAAGVSDAEVEKFSAAMVKMREVAPEAGATPTADQQAAMAGVLEASGLEIARFNEIATAVSSDAHLRARVELADARRGVGA